MGKQFVIGTDFTHQFTADCGEYENTIFLQMAECLDYSIIIKFGLIYCKPVTLLPYRGAPAQ